MARQVNPQSTYAPATCVIYTRVSQDRYKTEDAVERLGIERSYKRAAEASIVVLLGDASTLSEGAFLTSAQLLRKRIGEVPLIIPVMNKADLAGTGGKVAKWRKR